jgi:hypothetical protein
MYVELIFVPCTNINWLAFVVQYFVGWENILQDKGDIYIPKLWKVYLSPFASFIYFLAIYEG